MRVIWIAVSFVVCTLMSCEKEKKDSLELKTEKDKISYSIGLGMGKRMRKQAAELNLEIATRGMEDGYNGQSILSQQEVRQVMKGFHKKAREKMIKQRSLLGDKNSQEGKAFLLKNKGRKSVVTLSSGLQYEIITLSTGPSPSADDSVNVHYRGQLIDGTEFDSSYKRGKPAIFQVKRTIAGWRLALPKMKTGEKWKLFVPANLAYGERGSGHKIPPNATLIFEIELISIVSKPAN